MVCISRRLVGSAVIALLLATTTPASAQSTNDGTQPAASSPVTAAPTQRTRAQDAAALSGRDVSNESVLDAIRRSGLTESQIRARLVQAGHDPSIADPFFESIADRRSGSNGANGSRGGAGAGDVTERDPFLAALGSTARVELAPLPGSEEGDDDPRGVAGKATDAPTRPNRNRSEASGGLAIFGRDLFRGESGVFDPVVSGPVDDLYRLGVGDQLQLVYTGDVEDAFQLTVRRDGSVIIPQVGQITLAGLTMAGAKALLRSRAGRSYSGVESGTMNVDLTLSRVRTNMVFVVGEIERPGAYQVNALSTVFHALVRAGGPSTRGSLRRIELRRGGALIREIDLYDYVLRGDATNDVRTESGDIIFVPLNRRAVAMTGAVRRPAIFELKENERLGDLIGYSGGLLPTAATERLQVDRILPPERRVPGMDRVLVDVKVPNRDISALESVELQDHDVVIAYAIGDSRRNAVEIGGQVHQPGTYEIRPGMTLAALIAEAQGLLPYALSDRIKLFRPVVATGRVEQISLDFARDADFNIREFDRIEILDARVGYPGGQIVLTGAVRAPGSRPFIENQTVADVLHLAGGLREDAIEIEIATRRLGITYSDTLVHTQVLRLEAPGAIPAEAHSIVLGRDDQIHVRSAPGYRDPQSVQVSGLFAAPGAYPLRYEGEPISSVIERAGGALPNAFAPTFRIERGAVPIVVDFRRALRRDRAHDVRLRNGDRISIGPDPGVVAVMGEVVRPAVFPYVRGWSVTDYVNAAGGHTARADRTRTSVEYASGATSTSRRLGGGVRKPRVESGAVVRVPPKDSRNILEKGTQALTTVTSQAGAAIMSVLGARAILGN